MKPQFNQLESSHTTNPTFQELPLEDRSRLTQLRIPKEEVLIWACIEGVMGRAWMNDADPSFGIVAVADFLFLLGEPPMPMTDALIALIYKHGKGQIIVCESDTWKASIQLRFPDTIKSFLRYAFHWEKEGFNRVVLESYLQNIPSEYTMCAFDETLCNRALSHPFTADFCMFFDSSKAFLEKGLGYAFLHEDEIIAGASSYSACTGAIDITIGTVDAYRRKGLALACASKLILDCLDRDIYPRWDAANTDSVALAEKLGYRFKEAYTVYTLL